MKIAIIGGGAAGLMCTAALLESLESGVLDSANTQITLIDRNDGLGKKVIISGGGRCNVTTGFQDVRTALTKYPRGGKFLSSAMYNFPPKAVYEWFESHGVPLKTQTDMRVFPVSDDGHDIVHVFEKLISQARTKYGTDHIQVRLKSTVTRVEKQGEEFLVFFKNESEPLRVDRLVLTTGGQAYRATGSQGDGYAFAISLGHTITKLAPSLNAFFTNETWPTGISGLSFESAAITAHGTGMAGTPEARDFEHKQSFTGPFLFTHKGVSGPAVFALSSLVAFETYDKTNPLRITIDLFPSQTVESLFERVQQFAQEHSNKQFDNVLGMMIPRSLAEIAIGEVGISRTKRCNQIAKKELRACAMWLKAIPLHVVQRGAGDEFVTAGGVELHEVNPSTLESLICPGLYFAGEILNVDGYTGGFNLQASWAAGRLAGENIAQSNQ